MIFLFISYFIILLFLFYKRNKEPTSIESQIVSKFIDYSYFEIARKCHLLGYKYDLKTYLKQILVLFVILGALCQLTINNVLITVFICIAYALCIPFIYYQKINLVSQEHLNEELLNYIQTALMLLRENKTVFEVICLSEECAGQPIKDDLNKIIDFIKFSGDITKGLNLFEEKYNNSFIKNLNIIMINKNNEGAISDNLIDYFYINVENYEVLLNSFKAKRKANHILFYVIECLNAIGILSLTNFISIQNTNNSPMLVSTLTLYYILNLVTIIIYEQWCSKIKYFE